MTSHFENIMVLGISAAVPSKTIRFKDMYDRFGKESVDKTVDMIGVKEVRESASRQTASDLGYIAAKEIIEKKHIDINTIGVLIYVTQTPDYLAPATSFVLHKRLKLPEECVVYDINLGCSGYVVGLQTACAVLNHSSAERALFIIGDNARIEAEKLNRSSALLFGDGVVATLLEKNLNAKSIDFQIMSRGDHFSDIIRPNSAYRGMANSGYISEDSVRNEKMPVMDGVNVFTFTISDVVKTIKRFLRERDDEITDYDAVALHQANLYILKKVAKKLKMEEEQLLVSMDRYGNTNGASVGISLVDRYGSEEGKTVKLLMSSFGVGLSWGVMNLEIDVDSILPMVYSDDFFDDVEIENRDYNA